MKPCRLSTAAQPASPRGLACRVVPVLLSLIALGIARDVLAAEKPAAPGQRWALVIGVEKYQRANRLMYTVNDVEQIAATLRDRGDYEVRKIVETATDPKAQPTRANLLAELPRWLAQPGPEDHVLVYFSGHGFRARDGSLYLAPIDCDPDNAAATGVAVTWLRDQIGRCRAGFKLLVLDACHAGSERTAGQVRNVAAKELAAPFESLTGVVTLASSTADEYSLIWSEKQQSLFSYWLNQGLKGHADRDGDAAVTVDELYQYVFENVPYVAEKRFKQPQTPARIVGPKTPGVAVVLRPKPWTLKGTLDDMAEKLATTMQLHGLSAIGVPEFSVDAKKPELELGVDFGMLGRYCATELEAGWWTRAATSSRSCRGPRSSRPSAPRGSGPRTCSAARAT